MIKKLCLIIITVAIVAYANFGAANASVTGSIQKHQAQLAAVDSI